MCNSKREHDFQSRDVPIGFYKSSTRKFLELVSILKDALHSLAKQHSVVIAWISYNCNVSTFRTVKLLFKTCITNKCPAEHIIAHSLRS